jgi:hypothetical protein
MTSHPEKPMPFLRGSLSFERFSINNFESQIFDDSHIEQLQNHAAGSIETDSTENVHVGFLGGDHLFDQSFDLGKNVINDAIHAGIRIDTNQIPSAIRNAWLQMELAALAKDSPTGKVSKAQRKEAKESVEARCEAEAATGKYRKMSAFPWLWDVQRSLLYFGGAGGASGHCADLIERVFEVEVRRMTAGSIAQSWAVDAGRYSEVDDLYPASFIPDQVVSQMPWANEHSQAPDFLGNEFLLWLWWYLENKSDTITLADESEVTAMLTKTLVLECPLAENGKETISAESPVKLPEAMQAVRSGKLPRKSGMTLVRDGMRFDLVLQAETFAISGAKITPDDDEPMEIEDRINAIRFLGETVDGMFHTFCDLRTSDGWGDHLDQIQKWLAAPAKRGTRAA